MKRRTDELIDLLVCDARPVRPLLPPVCRAAVWLMLALAVMAVLIVSPRADLMIKLAEPRFLAEQAGAPLTAAGAASAAFALVVPGIDTRLALLPALPGLAWVGTLGAGCLADFWRAGSAALALSPDASCVLYIAAIGAPPVAVGLAMLRRGMPAHPRLTLFLIALAAAAIGNFGLRLFHVRDAGMMVLVWQFGSVLLLSALAALAGPRAFRRSVPMS